MANPKSPTVVNLRKMAKNRGLTGYSKLKKANLKALLGQGSPVRAKSPVARAKSPTVANLRAKAKRFGFTGYSKLKKANLKALFKGPKVIAKASPIRRRSPVVILSPVPTPNASPASSTGSISPSMLALAYNMVVRNENIKKYMLNKRNTATVRNVADHFKISRTRVRRVVSNILQKPKLKPQARVVIENMNTGVMYEYNPVTNRYKTFTNIIGK
jgi:predicted transcriptional regulator